MGMLMRRHRIEHLRAAESAKELEEAKREAAIRQAAEAQVAAEAAQEKATKKHSKE